MYKALEKWNRFFAIFETEIKTEIQWAYTETI